jgi:hypothetical protein
MVIVQPAHKVWAAVTASCQNADVDKACEVIRCIARIISIDARTSCGVPLIRFEILHWTNAEAWDLVRAGYAERHVVIPATLR